MGLSGFCLWFVVCGSIAVSLRLHWAYMSHDMPKKVLTIDKNERAKLDQVFMSVVLDAQAQVQQTKPDSTSNLAAMFHKESVADALQGCAMLIAGWNRGEIDLLGLDRTLKSLKALGLHDLAERVSRLQNLSQDHAKPEQS